MELKSFEILLIINFNYSGTHLEVVRMRCLYQRWDGKWNWNRTMVFLVVCHDKDVDKLHRIMRHHSWK